MRGRMRCAAGAGVARTIHEQPPHAAAGEHLRRHAAHAAHTHHRHRGAADALVVLDNTHALQGHQAAVGVGVDHLGAHLVHLCAGRRGGGARVLGDDGADGVELLLQLGCRGAQLAGVQGLRRGLQGGRTRGGGRGAAESAGAEPLREDAPER